MKRWNAIFLLGASALLLAACGRQEHAETGMPANAAAAPARAASAKAPSFQPPPESAIPADAFGDLVKLGEQMFRQTEIYAKPYVGNQLRCSNCHLDAGRLANAGPLWGAYGMYPAYRAKNGHVNSFAERLQGCFMYSMNGKAPPLGDKTLQALEAYAYWMSRGVPLGESMPGRGYPKLPKPAAAPDYARGAKVYGDHCALCHGANGEGQKVADAWVFPPLWGAQSFNWGAGMHELDKAAGFIKANMPLGRGNTLSDQDAWDVAYFMNAHERPQDPRFNGSVQETRKKYHDTPQSLYGVEVNGQLLGRGSP